MSIEIIRPSDAPLEHLITAHFTHMDIENIPQSYLQGKRVSDIEEMCQLRFAGDKNFAPCVRPSEVYSTDGIRAITYAERFATQYLQFMKNEAQLADGTPLEKLKSYGITAAQISLCRALKIHSVEAIEHLEGANLKSSGAVIVNVLKPMVKRYLEDRAGGGEVLRELADLRAELAALKNSSIAIPTVAEAEALDADLVELSAEAERDALKAEYRELTGALPRGNLGVETMRTMVAEAKAAK